MIQLDTKDLLRPVVNAWQGAQAADRVSDAATRWAAWRDTLARLEAIRSALHYADTDAHIRELYDGLGMLIGIAWRSERALREEGGPWNH